MILTEKRTPGDKTLPLRILSNLHVGETFCLPFFLPFSGIKIAILFYIVSGEKLLVFFPNL